MIKRDSKGRFIKGCQVWLGKKRSQETLDKIRNSRRNKNANYYNKDWLYNQYWKLNKSLSQIAKEENVSIAIIHRRMVKENIPRRPSNMSRFGKDNPAYKGGKFKNLGYVWILCREHPSVKNKTRKYMPEHYLVMEKHLGRYITKEERIHHKNGIKDDNRIENLQLFATNGKHISEELKLSLFSKRLLFGNLKTSNRQKLLNLYNNLKER